MIRPVFLFLIGILLAGGFLKQDNKNPVMSARYIDAPLKRVIGDISTHFKITFSYMDQIVDSIVVTTNIHREPFREVMPKVLKKTGIVYREIYTGHVILFRRTRLDTVPDSTGLQ